MSRGPLPPWAIDLVADGLPPHVLKRGGRREVILAMRRVMISASRAGWSWPDMHALLTERGGKKRRRLLGEQIASGRDGRPMSPPSRDALLLKHWEQIRAWQETRQQDWDRSQAIDHVERCRTFAEVDHALGEEDALLLQAIHDEASRIGTARVAMSTYRMEDVTGLARTTIRDFILPRLIEAGWLSLVQRGDAGTRRANLHAITLPEHLQSLATPTAEQPIPPISRPTACRRDRRKKPYRRKTQPYRRDSAPYRREPEMDRPEAADSEETDMARDLEVLRAQSLAELQATYGEEIHLDDEIPLAYCEHGEVLWLDVEEGDGAAWTAFVEASEAGALTGTRPGWTLTGDAGDAERKARPW